MRHASSKLAVAGATASLGGAAFASCYSAPQRTNPAWKQEMHDGKMKIGCAINTSSPLVTEMCASLGYDFLLIDQQHSAIDPEKLRTLIMAAHAAGAKTLVRVGGAYDRIGIQQALDLGSDGILIPCSNTAAGSSSPPIISTPLERADAARNVTASPTSRHT